MPHNWDTQNWKTCEKVVQHLADPHSSILVFIEEQWWTLQIPGQAWEEMHGFKAPCVYEASQASLTLRRSCSVHYSPGQSQVPLAVVAPTPAMSYLHPCHQKCRVFSCGALQIPAMLELWCVQPALQPAKRPAMKWGISAIGPVPLPAFLRPPLQLGSVGAQPCPRESWAPLAPSSSICRAAFPTCSSWRLFVEHKALQ